MASEDTAPRQEETSLAERAHLDHQYRSIGISAVAAALRYQGATKNPAYAPVPAKNDERLEAAAA